MRTATIGLVLLAGLAAALLWWSAGRGARPAAVEPPPASPSSDAPHVATELQREAPTGARSAAPEQPVERARESAPSSEGAGAEPALLRLRGTLRRSDDGKPVAHQRLVFLFGQEDAIVATDERGEFETGRVVCPGVVSVVHVADDERPEYAEAFEVEPSELVVPPGEAPPLELRLLVPDAWAEVEVREPGGGAAAGAFVQLALVRLEGERVRPWRQEVRACDAEGRTRFALRGRAGSVRGAVVARHGELASGIVELAPPWPDETLVLWLEPGGELRVRAVDENGGPLSEREVQVVLLDRDDGIGATAGTTAEDGRLLLTGLVPGRYRASVWVEERRERIAAEVEVARGEVSEVALELPRLALELAASGAVVDETGAPLAGVEVALEHSSGAALAATTDAGGRFEFLADPGEVVTVALDRDPWGDEYDPPRARVPFGTRGLAFRRVREAPLETLFFRVVDALDGAPVAGAAILVYRAPHLGQYAMERAEDGHASVRFKAHDSASFCVDAVGYRRRYLSRRELPPAGEGVEARIELERGFERALRVVAAGGEPLADAEVRAGGALVARSEVGGLARVDLAAWPAELLVSAPGFEPARVDPADFLWDLGPAAIELTRAAIERT